MAPSQPATETPAPKRLWNSVLTSTPVVLTVTATVLAGLSSSEMTRAQYYRALAAQNQSKDGDQWSFFQAKRIRGSIFEMTIDLLQAHAEADAVEAEQLRKAAERLVQELTRAKSEATRLSALETAHVQLGPAASATADAVKKYGDAVSAKLKDAETLQAGLQKLLASPQTPADFHYLHDGQLPEPSLRPVEADPRMREAIDAVRARRAESDTVELMRQLDEETIYQAIQAAEANIVAIESADKPISDRLSGLGQWVQSQLTLARAYQRAVRDLNTALSALPDKEPATAQLRLPAAGLSASATGVRSAAEELYNDFNIALHGYTTLRYRREGDLNQRAALVYEVQVRKNSALSDRHRERSKLFFYGMLAAQAGVTIASFSLAVRHRSLFWSLATLAGLGAVLFAGYVYLYM